MRSLLFVALTTLLMATAATACPLSKLQPQYFEGAQVYKNMQANYTWFLSACSPSIPSTQQSCQLQGGLSGNLGQFDPMGGQCQFLMNQTQPWQKLAASQGDGFYAEFASNDKTRQVEVIVTCGTEVGVKLETPVEVIGGVKTNTFQYTMLLSSAAVCGEIPPPSPSVPTSAPICPAGAPVSAIQPATFDSEFVHVDGKISNYTFYVNPCGKGKPSSSWSLGACSPAEGHFGWYDRQSAGGACKLMLGKQTEPWGPLAGSQGDGYVAFVKSENGGHHDATVIIQCDPHAGNLKWFKNDVDSQGSGNFQVILSSAHACEPPSSVPLRQV